MIPDPLPEPHYRPYTLVIDLDDMLIHSSWDVSRPLCNLFLSRETDWIVLIKRSSTAGERRNVPASTTSSRTCLSFTRSSFSRLNPLTCVSPFSTSRSTFELNEKHRFQTAAPIAEKLDPYGAYIPWKLFKEATRYKNKQLIKDLSYLNRPLERTIILDTDASHFQLQPENGIVLQPWLGTKGDDTCKELIAMIPFLEALAVKGVKDVRPVIKYYEGKHIPTAYYEAELRAKRLLEEEWAREKTDNSFKGWISSLFGGLTKVRKERKKSIFFQNLFDFSINQIDFFLAGENQTTIRDSAPETDVERVRKSAQKLYLDEQKYWKDNEEIINKQIEEDKQRQLNESVLIPFLSPSLVPCEEKKRRLSTTLPSLPRSFC